MTVYTINGEDFHVTPRLERSIFVNMIARRVSATVAARDLFDDAEFEPREAGVIVRLNIARGRTSGDEGTCEDLTNAFCDRLRDEVQATKDREFLQLRSTMQQRPRT